MCKKIIAFLVVFGILVTTVTGFAASTPFKLGYSIGPNTYQLTTEYCMAAEGVSVSDTSVTIDAGKSATYGFFMPFNSRSVKIKYANAAGTTTIDTGRRVYELDLSGSGEYILEFAKHLGIEPQEYLYVGQYSHVVREFVETLGEREFVITSTGGITIEGMEFGKELTPVNNSWSATVMPDVSDEVLKTLTTVLIDESAPILVVRGGKRYIDNNKPSTLPFEKEGTMYLPLNTVAKAFGYYSEELADKNYVLLRDDIHEYIWLNGNATISTSEAAPVAAKDDAVIFCDGEAWAAVRYFAELTGRTVEYKDGLVVIDDKYTVDKILNDSTMNAYAKSFFKEFKTAPQKGNTYYVAQSAVASDDNNGSIMSPFKTLAKASSVAKAGDTVIVKEGVYRETLTPQNNGAPGAPITYKAAAGEKVVISAADELGEFGHYKDNIYISAMDWDMGNGKNQLFIDGESMLEARYPNSPYWREEGISELWPTRGDFYVAAGDLNTVRSDTLLNQEPDYWKGGTYVGCFGYGYAIGTATIDSSLNGRLKVKDTTSLWWWDPAKHNNWSYGCIIGHMNALDTNKEWVKKGDMIYMIFPEGVDPLKTKVEAKARQLVINLNNKRYINIEGIETVGGSVIMDKSEMCMLNDMDMKYISHYTATNDQRDGYIDWPFDQKNPNGAPQRGEVGIYIGGTDNAVVNCTIDQSAGAGLYITGLYSYIENNVLSDCGYMGSYVSGININTAGTDSKSTARGGYAIYNNTVYNCGRSCLNVGHIEKLSHGLAPYLPMEVAYNDFHDGMICTLDTGIVYEYYIIRGLDKQYSEIHHNYIYSTQKLHEENPYTMAIYHDGGSNGAETYNNIVFNTEAGVNFSKPMFQQQALASPAYNHVYNNRALDPVKLEDLEEKHFPQDKMFYAGANQNGFEYIKNYELAVNGTQKVKYNANNAILSEGVVLENGIARFTGNGQYICFPDVDFGDGTDIINLTIYGDKYYSCDAVDIIVGEDIESGQLKKVTTQVSSLNPNSPDNMDISMGFIEGKHNVYIRVNDYRSLGVGTLTINELSEAGKEGSAYSVKVYGGSFTGYNIDNVKGQDGFIPEAIRSNPADQMNPIVKNTWDGTTLYYERLDFTKDTDIFTIAAGSSGSYTGQTVEVYLDKLEGEPIVVWNVNKDDFNDYTPVYIKLDKVIPKGIHSVYLNFPKMQEGSSTKTSNLYCFGFMPVGYEILKDAGSSVTILGGRYDVNESIQNKDMPFFPNTVKRPYYTEKGLINTYPGVVAAYTNVDFKQQANKFSIHYASAEGFDGQKVEVRIDDLKSAPVAEFVTKGNGWESFNTQTVDLITPVDAGVHKVYLCFGGDKGSPQTCKVHWFEFAQ